MDEYRVKVTVRNNLLLSAIESAGYVSQSEFARAAGISPLAVAERMKLNALGVADL